MGLSAAKEITVLQEKQLDEQRTALKAFLGKILALLPTVCGKSSVKQHHSLLGQ